jgi:hypothetical protein
MKSMRRILIGMMAATALLMFLGACMSFSFAAPESTQGGSKGGTKGGSKVAPPAKRDLPFPAISNNSTVRLEAGDYVGDLTIRANKVTIIGRGVGATRIRGNLTIIGNNCTMDQLTITGFVRIIGNNADLRGAYVEGKVQSTGKNNVW